MNRFMTANRTVRTGLTASAVISVCFYLDHLCSVANIYQSWLWSTALLGSSFVGYSYGVAGPFWFAAGCSPMIVFFALLGISCKRKIPEAHTSLEVVRIRYGMSLQVASCLAWLTENRPNGPRCVHGLVFGQQYLCLRQHAARRRCRDHRCVSSSNNCCNLRLLLTLEDLVCTSSLLPFYFRLE